MLLAVVVIVFVMVKNRTNEQQANTESNNQVAATEQNSNGTNAATEETQANENSEVSEEPATNEGTQSNATETTPAATVSGEAVGELPNAQSTKSEDSYSEAAQVGEGVTHLARRALHSYLADKAINDLSAAGKIFAEDYVSKNSTPVYLGIGEGRTFSASLLDEAVTNAQALSAAQIANLQQYVVQVPGL